MLISFCRDDRLKGGEFGEQMESGCEGYGTEEEYRADWLQPGRTASHTDSGSWQWRGTYLSM